MSYFGVVCARISASEKDLPVFLQMDNWISFINVTHNYETDVGNTLLSEKIFLAHDLQKCFFPVKVEKVLKVNLDSIASPSPLVPVLYTVGLYRPSSYYTQNMNLSE